MNPPSPFSFNFPPLPPDFDDPPIPTWDPPPPPAADSNEGWIIALLIVVFAAIILACLVKGYRKARARAEVEATAAAAGRMGEWQRPRPLPHLEPHRHQYHDEVQLPRARAANPAARLPSFRYNRSVKHNVTGGGEEAATCSVCLGVFQLGEMVRLLPACLHLYHAECIDPWLDSHSTCPICRADADPRTDGARLPPV